MGVQLDPSSNPASVTHSYAASKFPDLLKFQFPHYKVEVRIASSLWEFWKNPIKSIEST